MSDLRDRLRALGILAVSSALDDIMALATRRRTPTSSRSRARDYRLRESQVDATARGKSRRDKKPPET